MALPLRGVRAGRIAGIEVRLDWSLIVIFWLIVVNLSMGLFAFDHPEWSAGLRWATAAIAAVLFLLSILAHELAHGLVGRAQGLEIAGITLFMFGGVARTKKEPQSPRRELLMTMVGPLTSMLIGIAALLIGTRLADLRHVDMEAPLSAFARVGPLATLLLWLGPVNIVLGFFNLVPAFPLDGGRVLRAALWAATGDLQKATRWAADVGRAFALIFILAGISMILGIRVPFLGSGLVAGLWIACIGWFLNMAAVASHTQVVVHDLLEQVPVSRLMQRDPVATVPPDLPISTFVDEGLMATEQRAFPVLAGEELVGIVTAADVRQLPRTEWNEKQVRDIMIKRPDLSVAAPDEGAASAFDKLASRDVEQLPVMDQGRFIGLFRRRDVIRWLGLQNRGLSSLRQRQA